MMKTTRVTSETIGTTLSLNERKKDTEQGRICPKRILCVDDDRNFLELVSEVLHLGGYEVKIATSAKYAIQELMKDKFDLVVTDLCMPGTDGIQFIRELREFKPSQRVIVITGFPSQRTQWETLRLGTINYIAKPFSPKSFLKKVNQALVEPTIHLIGFVELTCEELIQLYSLGQKSIVLKIRSNGSTGVIYFKKGKPVHAEAGNLIGEDAFFEILTWKTGIFSIEAFKEVKRTIGDCTDALLIEGARRQDECTRCGKECLAKASA
ncbi:response regulator [candidate division WOR-3 bacterium]|uniref:Response regulator n=1 Tax=candidate division WOR-3 bacterium TaxID=2052148 RepID=A0A9D5KDW1_UNCW3|nr:response regulator [candidate division WOR-3 bacterium]MBD3365706.1 response regulator [candidate division WOR-3 bacterium]